MLQLAMNEQHPLYQFSPYHGSVLIGGEFRQALSGRRMERKSPAHQLVAGSYPDCSAEDASAALAAARQAFDSGIWSDMPARQRGDFLLRVAAAIEQQAEPIALIECLETGKPLLQARSEVQGCADLWRYAAALARTLHGESYNSLGDNMLALVVRQPAGVVSLITPWNFPLWILSQKLPFALAAGCSVVVKPSEYTNGSALMLGEILQQAGLPAGVVNIVTGYGNRVGAALVNSPLVDMISFTGSTRVGREIASQAGSQLKKVALELGGKNPQIIFPDCDWQAAVDAVVFGVYFNAGECCNSGSRIIVHKDIIHPFSQAVVAKARQVTVGDPLHPQVKVGAIINENQFAGILSAIQNACSQGASCLLGGHALPGEQGLFIAPTVLGDIRPDMEIARQEIFGPVLAILPFDTAEQAISIANDTSYGLSAAVWSKNIDTCLYLARKINAGTIWVNTFLDGYAELPFGGMKQSGTGRELGIDALADYSEQKTIQLHTGDRRNGWLKND